MNAQQGGITEILSVESKNECPDMQIRTYKILSFCLRDEKMGEIVRVYMQ